MLDVAGRGGTRVLGSAAAVTAGTHAISVYEIYKAGEPPRWLAGLDLLGRLTGLGEVRDFTTTNLVRDRLAAAGVQVRDTADGAQWSLTEVTAP